MTSREVCRPRRPRPPYLPENGKHKRQDMAGGGLKKAKAARNDEFRTQYNDIEREMSAYLDYDPDVFRGKTVLLPCDDPEWSNFTLFFARRFGELGLKKLISTSRAPESEKTRPPQPPTLWDLNPPQPVPEETRTRGKALVLEHGFAGGGRTGFRDLHWEYLDDGGDFRSAEVTSLRDEADFIITNPPFSLFREFLAWTMEGDGRKFAIIGSRNALTYKEVFPLIMENKVWLGATGNARDMVFGFPDGAAVNEKAVRNAVRLGYAGNCARVGSSCWFTNVEHSLRHVPMRLPAMLRDISAPARKDGRPSCAMYPKYDNYDAINVDTTAGIPSDYGGVMGVPVTFLDKYCPEQFEIVEFRKDKDGRNLVFGNIEKERDKELFRSTRPATSVPGLIKNAEGSIGGRTTYVRVTIRRLKK